jgi:transglutaminase-like putative cysteine protease
MDLTLVPHSKLLLVVRSALLATLVSMPACVRAAEKNQDDANPEAVSFSEPIEQVWRIGVQVTASSGACRGIIVTSPVPLDWDEQTVTSLKEEKSDQVDAISFRTIDEGVKQMQVSIPHLAAGETARAVIVLKIEKRHTNAPSETQRLRLPNRAETKKLRSFLNPSPFIESKDRKILELAEQIGDEQNSAWEQVGAIFDWVKENIDYKFDAQIKSCLTALDAREGDCEEMSSLFIAICRAKGIPARAVWIPGHTYPEFYLVDSQGEGHWYPCQVAGGDHDFGRMPEDRPILQRGDNFRIPGTKQAVRYVQPTLTARDAEAAPKLEWILEKVSAE